MHFDLRYSFAWVIVALVLLNILLNFLFLLYDAITSIYAFLKNLYLKRKSGLKEKTKIYLKEVNTKNTELNISTSGH